MKRNISLERVERFFIQNVGLFNVTEQKGQRHFKHIFIYTVFAPVSPLAPTLFS